MKNPIPWKIIIWVLALARITQGQTSLPEINFVPDPQFASSVDWDSQLPPIPASESAIDRYYHLAVADDERLFLIDRATKSILRFDAQGRYIGRFGGEGRKRHLFYNTPPNQVEVVGNRYVVVNSNFNGRLALFDLEGRHQKNIFLDYPISSFRVLADGRLLIKGWIQLKNFSSRDHIAILDLETQETEKVTVVYNHEEARAESPIRIPYRDSYIVLEPTRNNRGKTYILTTEEGHILVGHSASPSIQCFQGTREIGTFTLPLSVPTLTEEDIEKYESSFTQSFKRLNLPDSLLKRIRIQDFMSKSQPYYYHLCTLPGHRLLAFKLHDGEERLCLVMREEGDAWQNLGDHLLKIEGYDPPFLSRGHTHLAFRNGWLYALVTQTDKGMKHFRIIRAKEKP